MLLSIFPWPGSAAPIAIGSPTVLGQINLYIDGDFQTHARLIDFGSAELTADIGNPLGSLLLSPLFFGGTADGNTGNGFGGERVGATSTVILYLHQYQKTSDLDIVQFHTVSMDVMAADLSAKHGEFVSATAGADVSAFPFDPTTDPNLLLGEGNIARVRTSVSGALNNWTWSVSFHGTSVTQDVEPGDNEFAVSIDSFTVDVPFSSVAVGESLWVLYSMFLNAAPGEFETLASARLLDPPSGGGVTVTATDATAVPEPSVVVLLGAGLGLRRVIRRQRTTAA
jgi:hypothetical protein